MTSESHISVLLLAEDELLVSPVAEYLELKAIDATIATDVRSVEVRKQLDSQLFDICVVYPSRDNQWALTSLEDVRMVSAIPVIAVMRDAKIDTMVAGYEKGADDVQLLPISSELLAAKMQAIVRRVNAPDKPTEYALGKVVFSVARQTLERPNGDILATMSGREMELLELLAMRANQTVEKSVILRKIWKEDNYFAGRSLAVYVNKLRKTLAVEPSLHLVFVHGKGYKLYVD